MRPRPDDNTLALDLALPAEHRLRRDRRISDLAGETWWAQVVSNHRPLACKASALPLSYAPASTPVGATALSVPGTLPAVKTLATSPRLPGEGRCTGTG